MGTCTGLGHAEADPEPARPGLLNGISEILKCPPVLGFIEPEMLHMEGSSF